MAEFELGDIIDDATAKKGGAGGRGGGSGGGGGGSGGGDDKKLRYLENSVARLTKDFLTHAQGKFTKKNQIRST